MKPFTYERARTPAEAAPGAARKVGAKFIAGGTNLLDLMKVGIEAPTHLIDVNGLSMDAIEEWNECIDVNIKGVLWGIAAALPRFKVQKSGHFINVSSVAGHRIGAGGAIYQATKHSVRVISEALRQEVKPYNIRTTILSPGAVDTELPLSVKAEGVAEGIVQFYKSTAIPASSFARCALFAISQPDDVDVNEILFRPDEPAALSL